MELVVTGGSGFLGSHIAEELLGRGHQVGIVDRNPPPEHLLGARACHYLGGDVLDADSLERAFRGADAVCHVAGVGDVYLAAKEPHTAAVSNVVGTAQVAGAALRSGVRRLVYASTWEVYGAVEYEPLDEDHPCRPDHPYNITKYAGERLALSFDRLNDLPTVALRLGTAYGRRMRPNSVFSIFRDRARRGEPIVLHGTGEQRRQFTHATDIGRAFALAVEGSARGVALNIVADEAISVRRLAERVRSRFPTEIRHAPARRGDITPALVSSERAKAVLGWAPLVPFDRGLDDLLQDLDA